MLVTFFLHGEPRLEELSRLDPDRDWREFVTGERAWILQTFLRLRAAGCDVQLTSGLPGEGIVVFSSKQRRLLQQRAKATRALLIGVREDVGEALIADLEVVQNGRQADSRRRFFIPLWAQPGLLARDPSRGNGIETVAYKGFASNLHPAFLDGSWAGYLRGRHIRWLTDAAPYKRDATDAARLDWNDFRCVDLIVAVRPPDPGLHPRKPATKLYNAWHAGVPALLGPEVAYRELRRSSLDYLEVTSPGEALEAIARLRADPQLYAAMVANGRERAQEFSAGAITARWRELLSTIVPRLAGRRDVRHWRGRSLRTKDLARRVLRVLGMWR